MDMISAILTATLVVIFLYLVRAVYRMNLKNCQLEGEKHDLINAVQECTDARKRLEDRLDKLKRRLPEEGGSLTRSEIIDCLEETIRIDKDFKFELEGISVEYVSEDMAFYFEKESFTFLNYLLKYVYHPLGYSISAGSINSFIIESHRRDYAIYVGNAIVSRL